MARTFEDEVSTVRVFQLKLISVGFNNKYDDDDCTILHEGLSSSTLVFIFEDGIGRKWIHYQVPPSAAASNTKAAEFLRVASLGNYSTINFLDKDPLDAFSDSIGKYFSCCCRRRVTTGPKGKVEYLNVESFFYPIAFNVADACFHSQYLGKETWKIDLKETARAKKQRIEWEKRRKALERAQAEVQNRTFVTLH